MKFFIILLSIVSFITALDAEAKKRKKGHSGKHKVAAISKHKAKKIKKSHAPKKADAAAAVDAPGLPEPTESN